jgi:2-oxoglutarate ferredoxin oxidoreductase subunit alpha
MDPKLVEQLIAEQYKGKEKLLSSNIHALHLGRDWALQNLKCPVGLRIKKADKVGDRIFIEGNSAAALGAVYGGATVCAWYPITPSSSLADAFASHCKKLRHDPETGKAKYAIVQGEDELASIGIVVGASWNGARAFTATSGPGISLMQEFIGLSYFAEIPAVIMNVQRLCLAWRHQACAAVSGRPGRSFRIRGDRFRPRRASANHDLRHARSRYRHEPPAVPAAAMGRLEGI